MIQQGCGKQTLLHCDCVWILIKRSDAVPLSSTSPPKPQCELWWSHSQSFTKQISQKAKARHFSLASLPKCKPLWVQDQEKVIHSFFSSYLDYCISLYTVISQSSLLHLQLEQNSAAWLLSGFNKWDITSLVFPSSYWLSIYFTSDFKSVLLVFKTVILFHYLTSCTATGHAAPSVHFLFLYCTTSEQ